MSAMDKAKIVRLWAELGEARPSYEEFERTMTRPVRMNKYGFVDAIEILDWAFRDVNCCDYFRLRHLLCSRHVAKLKAAERRPRYYAAENERRRALAAEAQEGGIETQEGCLEGSLGGVIVPVLTWLLRVW